MKHQILIYPHPCLTTPAEKVTQFDGELKQLLAELYETMYESRGIGLAAPQVNISKRILVMDISEDKSEPRCLINPQIIEQNGRETDTEGCLSFPGLYVDIERAISIKIQAQDENGEPVEFSAEGLTARCIQHEMDHLDGIVFVDHLSRLKRERALKKLKKLLKSQA